MRWFIFIVDPEGIHLETKVEPRPADARPDNGDPFTPYYKTEEHYDNRHIHIKGSSLEEALTRAKGIRLQTKVEPSPYDMGES